MDTNSRNIVKFIATITVAAMLIMAARYYAMSGPVEAPPVEAEAALLKVAPSQGESSKPDSTPEEVEDDDVIEQDVEIKMGDPSVDIADEDIDYQELPPSNDPEAEPGR